MQRLVIGDIHGCYFELQALLDKAGLAEGDESISLGDCVDRGPETPQVLRFFQDTPHARLIMGNHERKHVRGSRGEVGLARSQQISKVQFGEAYADALAFMGSLPLYIDLPEVVIVHGYFEPGLPLDQQNPQVLCGTMGGEKRLQELYDRPWYELYDGDKPILVGHKNYTGTDQPFLFHDRVFGLDTDCVTGKALTGILLPSFRFVSIPSRADHWAQMRSLYAMHVPAPKPAAVVWDGQNENVLLDLIGEVHAMSASILCELQSEPGYTDLPRRQQAGRFGERAGSGPLATLLQLDRLGKLDSAVARRVLRTPEGLTEVIQRIEHPR